MIFTTVKKKVEKEELFPNDAVMTLLDGRFSLNKKAMELFGFQLNTANTSRIANGFDDNNNVVLATIDTNDMYTNNITAKNDFSSQLLSTRLSKQFNLSEGENYFKLNLIEELIGVKYVGVELIQIVNTQPKQIDEIVAGFNENNSSLFADDTDKCPSSMISQEEQEETALGIKHESKANIPQFIVNQIIDNSPL